MIRVLQGAGPEKAAEHFAFSLNFLLLFLSREKVNKEKNDFNEGLPQGINKEMPQEWGTLLKRKPTKHTL